MEQNRKRHIHLAAMEKMEMKGEDVSGSKQKHARCKYCILGSNISMQDRKVKATRVSIVNTLVLSQYSY